MDALDHAVDAFDEVRDVWRKWLDPGLFLIGGLGFLFFWRLVIGYGCCGCRLRCFNHIFLMYMLILILGLYGILNFLDTLSEDYLAREKPVAHADADLGAVWWLRPFLWLSPLAVIITLFLAVEQTIGHMYAASSTAETLWRHDRAVLIITMPAVFGVMMLSSTVPFYQLAIGGDYYGILLGSWENQKEAALNLQQSYFFVADLYEAWAMYQFAMLIVGLVETGMRQRHALKNEALDLYKAMSDLLWLGPWLFILVCMTQAGFSLAKQLTGHLNDTEYMGTIERFDVAGFVASSAAIYNIHIVESRFSVQLHRVRPLFKFFSVKMLISLSFFQSFMLDACQKLNTWQPDSVQSLVKRFPVLGDIMNFSDVQMRLFYPTLITYECLLAACLHSLAWSADEDWYEDTDAIMEADPEVMQGLLFEEEIVAEKL